MCMSDHADYTREELEAIDTRFDKVMGTREGKGLVYRTYLDGKFVTMTFRRGKNGWKVGKRYQK